MQGLQIQPTTTNILKLYYDSDWAGCPTTRRSTTGYCVFLGQNLVSWSYKKQPTVARSSTEAEYIALASAASEVTWMQHLLKDLHVSLHSAPQAFCDNIAATYIAHNHVLQPADVLTKPLPSPKFQSALINLCLTSAAQIEGACKNTKFLMSLMLAKQANPDQLRRHEQPGVLYSSLSSHPCSPFVAFIPRAIGLVHSAY